MLETKNNLNTQLCYKTFRTEFRTALDLEGIKTFDRRAETMLIREAYVAAAETRNLKLGRAFLKNHISAIRRKYKKHVRARKEVEALKTEVLARRQRFENLIGVRATGEADSPYYYDPTSIIEDPSVFDGFEEACSGVAYLEEYCDSWEHIFLTDIPIEKRTATEQARYETLGKNLQLESSPGRVPCTNRRNPEYWFWRRSEKVLRQHLNRYADNVSLKARLIAVAHALAYDGRTFPTDKHQRRNEIRSLAERIRSIFYPRKKSKPKRKNVFQKRLSAGAASVLPKAVI